jgi:uncharacterized protein with PIN domain
MSGLFIRLYLDEDVDVLVAEMVRAHGFDALTTREARRLGDSDADQLAFATAEGRVFLTHNRALRAAGRRALPRGQRPPGRPLRRAPFAR